MVMDKFERNRMKHFSIAVLSFALVFAACGGDSSSTSANESRVETDSSSSVVLDDSEKSSDSKSGDKVASSSSVKQDDKSVSSSSEKKSKGEKSSSSRCEDCDDEVKSSSDNTDEEDEVTSSSSEEKSSSSEKDYSFLNPDVEYGEFTDARDGQVYKTITLGTQTWMAENLNYDYPGSMPCYESGSFIDCSFGHYYSWAMAIDSIALRTTKQKLCGYMRECGLAGTIQGVCPDGWHLPSTDEFRTLFDLIVETIGDSSSASVRTVGEWAPFVPTEDDIEHGYNPHINEATNAIGFSIRPSGTYECDEDLPPGQMHGKFKCRARYIYEWAEFWTSDDSGGNFAFIAFGAYNDMDRLDDRQKRYKPDHIPVRCVKDAE